MSLLAVASKTARVLRWRSLWVDLDQCLVAVDETVLSTSPAEFALVSLLLRHRNAPLTKETILRELYGPQHGRDLRQVDMFVARLQRSLASAGLEDAVMVVPGRGYGIMDAEIDAATLRSVRPSAGYSTLAA